MNSRTRFQTIALKILGILLIAVGINQLAGLASAQWNAWDDRHCTFSLHERHDHNHRTVQIDVEHDVRRAMREARTEMERARERMHSARHDIRREMAFAQREMRASQREMKDALRDMDAETERFQ